MHVHTQPYTQTPCWLVPSKSHFQKGMQNMAVYIYKNSGGNRVKPLMHLENKAILENCVIIKPHNLSFHFRFAIVSLSQSAIISANKLSASQRYSADPCPFVLVLAIVPLTNQLSTRAPRMPKFRWGFHVHCLFDSLPPSWSDLFLYRQ